jgi:cell division protein FtsI (penicillin-binding protein 3)
VNAFRLVDPRGRWVRMRMGILCALLAVGLGVVISSGYRLMVKDGSAWRDLADKQRERRLHVVPKRGTIYDRNGSALAVSVEVPSVSLDAVDLLKGVPGPKLPAVAREAANEIAAALSLDPATVERKILAKRRFAWLKRQVTAEEVERVRRLGSAEVMGPRRIAGVSVEGEGHRYYPRRELAGPLLGFVAPDGAGKDGLELVLDSSLEGRVGELQGLRDRAGELLLADGVKDDQALAGHDLYLTVDQGIEFVAERELAAAVRTFEAAGGSVIVVDPHTGELLAMASYPGYNPNDYTQSEAAERRDRGASDIYEPGSSVKIFTLATGLAAGVITPTQNMYCEKGQMVVDNVTIRDTHPAGWIGLPQVLSMSSNICAAKVGLALGADKLYQGMRRFGFGQTTGVPLPGESSGTLRPRGRPWVQVETAAASFGQGISVTNLQMAMGVAAIANGGNLMQPILVRKVATATGEVVRESAPEVLRRVIPASVARTVAELMVGVTEGEGTGVEAAIEGYQVAGKTATAQKTDPATGRYSLDDYIASFVGFVPAKNPVVAIAVMVDSPRVEHAGGAVAAPIFRRVAKMALEYKGLTPRGTDHADLAVLARAPDPASAAYELLRQAQGKKPAVQEVAVSGPVGAGQVRVPDFTGWPMREAVKKTIELELVPRVEGSGLLAREVPPPGGVLAKGQKLTLVFEPAS